MSVPSELSYANSPGWATTTVPQTPVSTRVRAMVAAAYVRSFTRVLTSTSPEATQSTPDLQ